MNSYNNCNGEIYTVKAGDTMYSISTEYRIPLAVLLRANPFVDIYNMRIGSKICIPIMQGMPPIRFITHVITDTDTLASLLERYDLDFEDLLKYNDMLNTILDVGTVLQIPIKRR